MPRSIAVVALVLCSALLNAQERSPPPLHLRGTVLDLFDDGRILLSLGKDDGLEKGLLLMVGRQPRALFIGCIEVEELGAKYSLGRTRGRLREPVRRNDIVFAGPDRVFYREYVPVPTRNPLSGGAIIEAPPEKKQP